MGSCISSLHSMCTNNLLQGNCLRQNSMGVPVYSCRQNRCVSTVHTFLVNNQVIHVVMFALRHFLGLINLFISAIFFPISLFMSRLSFSFQPYFLSLLYTSLTSREIYIFFLQCEFLYAHALNRTPIIVIKLLTSAICLSIMAKTNHRSELFKIEDLHEFCENTAVEEMEDTSKRLPE